MMASIVPFVFVLAVFYLLYRFASYYISKYLSEENKRFQEERNRFLKAYKTFLAENDGCEFFCYTNRNKFCDFIEAELIPNLDDSINIVKLNGKLVHTEFEREFISHSLYCIKNIGFPNVMKIVDGRVLDCSLHKEIYNSINNKKYTEAENLIYGALLKLNAVYNNG